MPNAWSRVEQTGETEAQVLSALVKGIHPADSLGRIHHLPKARMSEVINGLHDWGLVDSAGRFTDVGETKARIEALTDAWAEAPYEGLPACELDQLVSLLQPISERLRAAPEIQSRREGVTVADRADTSG